VTSVQRPSHRTDVCMYVCTHRPRWQSCAHTRHACACMVPACPPSVLRVTIGGGAVDSGLAAPGGRAAERRSPSRQLRFHCHETAVIMYCNRLNEAL
jgi:hypothetical protein